MTSIVNAPSSRGEHTAIWTGSVMIVWGGYNGSVVFNTGGIYDPSNNSWVSTSITNAPDPRGYQTTIWTGSVLGGKMIIWGGFNGTSVFNNGGKYDPVTDSWTGVSTTNAPSARYYHTVVWTGGKMIVWGGYNGASVLNSGGIYDPITDSWSATSTVNAPSPRGSHTAVWTGSAPGGKMIIWGGFNGAASLNTGGIYDPVSDSWTTISTTNAPSARYYHTAVWTSEKMIVWGGWNSDSSFRTGGIYDPVNNIWSTISTNNTLGNRYDHTAIWTGPTSGGKMIIWGGMGSGIFFNDGGIYDPNSDIWETTTINNAPESRDFHTAIWTGSAFGGKMIVWGGWDGSLFFNTGGIYTNPTIGIKKEGETILSGFSLQQNYPNPFNPATKIKFSIPQMESPLYESGTPSQRHGGAGLPAEASAQAGGMWVKLIIYDILGREVATLVNKNLQPGTYEVEWNASKYPSGMYFYRLSVSDANQRTPYGETNSARGSGLYFFETKKMALIK